MSKKLFVGNLPYAFTQEELSGLFTQWGPVQYATVITDHATGQSKGFGFVELPDETAGEAITKMNGSPINGRPLVVNEARPREARPAGGGARPYRSAEPRYRTEGNDDASTFNPGYSGTWSDNPEARAAETDRENRFGGRDKEAGGRDYGRDRESSRGRDSNRGRKDRDRRNDDW